MNFTFNTFMILTKEQTDSHHFVDSCKGTYLEMHHLMVVALQSLLFTLNCIQGSAFTRIMSIWCLNKIDTDKWLCITKIKQNKKKIGELT